MFLLSSYSKTDQEGARNTFPVLFKPLSLSYSVAKENFRSPSQLLHGNCIICPELHQQPNLETVQTVQDDSPPLMSMSHVQLSPMTEMFLTPRQQRCHVRARSHCHAPCVITRFHVMAVSSPILDLIAFNHVDDI